MLTNSTSPVVTAVFNSTIELANLNGRNGFTINGITANDQIGAVASAGDINGDGIQDIIIGAPNVDLVNKTDAGQSYVVFGRRGNWISPFELSNLNGTNGFIINGIAAGDASGNVVAPVGDFNGDGLPDIIVSARYANPAGKSHAGQSYVVFGKRNWTSPLELSSLNGINGLIINGIKAADECSYSAASAGDFNADGLQDIIIGAPYEDPASRTDAGQSYVVFGRRGNWISPLELSSLNSTNGLVINGISAGDHSGYSVASAGDFNGDGIQDVIIGARLANPAGRADAGQSYVVFGKSNWTSPFELSTLNGTNGLIINGIAANDWSGQPVASAGDFNNDGIQDVIIGAYQADPAGKTDAGQSYVVFGKRSKWISPLELSSLNGTNGFIMNGIAAGDWAGRSVASAGDFNNDGIQDVLIGASIADSIAKADVGQSYVVFGKRDSWNSPLELSRLNTTNGLTINGVATGDANGWSVASAGDFNNDGLSDIIMSAISASSANKTAAGQVYVLFGDMTVPLVNNQLIITANQAVVLNANALSVFSGNYTGEVYYSLSSVQNGRFELVGNRGIAVTQLTQTQLNNNLVQFISTSTAVPSYFVSASTGIGNAIVPVSQAAQINFAAPAISTNFSATIELSNLNGKNGFAINGMVAGDYSGYSVASAGDINGDGVADLVIGAWDAAPSGRNTAGQSYVVFGQRSSWSSPFELSNLNGTNGFIINGIAAGDYSGNSVASAGDMNSDGLQDIIIGAGDASPAGRSAAGQSYLVFGKRNWISPLELSSLNGTNGFTINGIGAGDDSGISVASAGDMNGDGLQDIIIGADQQGSNTGQSYVIFGQHNSWYSPLELSSLNGTNGFMINGVAVDTYSGTSVASAGDMNGDGLQDIIIGAPQANPAGRTHAGQSYIVFGQRSSGSSPLELSNLNGTNGFIINGIALSDFSGCSVASAGDVNGDGLQDLIIGAYQASPPGRIFAGQSYIIFGKRSVWSSPLELSSLNGTSGFIINGIKASDFSGASVASARDINGDGVQDILIGAFDAHRIKSSPAGQSYVVFGKRSNWSSPFELSSLNGTNGFIINGIAAGDQSGMSVASAGDINSDGLQDILIGAPYADPANKTGAGQSYVVFGDITIPIINNQFTIAPGQISTLNSNALLAFTGNYTGEVYFSVSNVQNGYFQLLNNPGISVNQFTQTQLNNGLVQFVSNSSAVPAYSVSASTGIGNAIAPAPQTAQIYFSAPTTTVNAITSTITYTNASTSVPTTVQVTSSSTPIPTTTIIVSTPQGNITITNTTQSTSITSSSSSVMFTTSSSSVSIPTTTQPMISSTSSSSTSITIPTTSGVINITSTASGQVTVTVPTTMTITSANTAATTTMPMTQNTATPSSAAISSTALMSTLLASTAAASSTSVMTSTSTPKASSTTPAVVDTNKNSGSDISINIISAVAGAGGCAALLAGLYLLNRYRKQRTTITQNTDVFTQNKMYLPELSGNDATLSETDVDGVGKVHHYEKIGAADSPYEQVSPAQGTWSSLYANNPAKEPGTDAWATSDYATRHVP